MSIPNEQLLLIEQLLNLPGVRVLSAEIGARDITIQVEITDQFATCRHCGRRATEFHGHGEVLRLRHLPVFDRDVHLSLRPKRYRCQQCDDHPTTTQRDDWYDARSGCTRAFANALLRALVKSTLSDVARLHRVSYDLLRGLLGREVSAAVDWSQISSLPVLGLDEIALLKGHRDFVTIVSTRDERGGPVLLAVLEGRAKETVSAFLRSIPEALRATIEQVCTDLYEGFANAVREVVPTAGVIADRFHVAKLYRGAVDTLRKSEMKEIKQTLSAAEYAGLKGVLWAFRRNRRDLDAEALELLDLLFECSPSLRQAHALREEFSLIFETKQSKETARRAITAWSRKVRRSGLGCFDSFLATLEHWMDEITNYFVSRLSSGWVEGFNNKIKVLKRRCYGLSNPANLFRRIWLDLNGDHVFAL